MTYSEKLKDPRWQKLRLQVFERDKWTCRDCGANDKPLHAHHTYYDKGADPWDYNENAIMCLCENCHQIRHMITDAISRFTGLMPIEMLEIMLQVSRFSYIIYTSKNYDQANSELKNAKENLLCKIKEVNMELYKEITRGEQ